MTASAQHLLDTTRPLDLRSHSFSSSSWLSYFEGNKDTAASLDIADKTVIADSVRDPLVRSLQRFQIGESGDGAHLKKYAATIKDPAYEQCIELFVKQEQGHARMLAQLIQSMDGRLLSRHWSALAFVLLRRMLGLKTEVFVLLIAEVIGKCFYKACAEHLEGKPLKDAFSLLVIDQIFHLEFHCTFMRAQTLQFSPLLRQMIYYLWGALFYVACMVFVADHLQALGALNIRPQAFWKDCSNTFQRAAVKALV